MFRLQAYLLGAEQREWFGGRGLVCHYHQSIEEAWWAASGEGWWTGSGRDAACPLVSEDWAEGGLEKQGHMNPLVVQHPSSEPRPGPESLQVHGGYVHWKSRKIISKHCVVFPYLCAQRRYIIKSPESELKPVKLNRTHENCNWPFGLLFSVQFLLLNLVHKVTVFVGFIEEFCQISMEVAQWDGKMWDMKFVNYWQQSHATPAHFCSAE